MRKTLLLNSREIIGVLMIVAVILLLGWNQRDLHESVVEYHQSQFNIFAPEVDRAAGRERHASLIDLSHIYGGIVPHHIPTTIPELATFYERLRDRQAPKHFIVIGPDHVDGGKAPVVVSNQPFFTVYGEVRPVDGLASTLQERNLALIDEAPFDPEHSVGSQILIISKLFPEAKVTPIILRSDVTPDHAFALGTALASKLDEETVLIASVDFSHYLSTEQAVPVDQLSAEVIRRLDVYAFRSIEADSNQSMLVFMQAMKAAGATESAEMNVFNTNSFMQNTDYTTGYVFGYWGKKDI